MNSRISRFLALLLVFSCLPVLHGCTWKNGEESSQAAKEQQQEQSPPVLTDLDPEFLQKARPRSVDDLPVQRNLYAEHYPVSNELRIDLFRPYIEGLGGGYVGVGTDQNLTFMAWARSDVAWLMDFDPVVVAVNRIHVLFLKHSPTYQDYRKLWQRNRAQKKASFQLIQKAFRGDPDYPIIRQAWKLAVRGYNDVPMRLQELEDGARKFGLKSFHNDPDDYKHIHRMASKGRIICIPGDLRGKNSLQSIAAAAHRVGVPVQVFYMSNAEEYFMNPPGFRKNILSLPITDQSVAIRTLTNLVRSRFGFPEGEKYPDEFPFHYNVQPLSVMKEWMRYEKDFKVAHMLFHRKRLQQGLSIVEKTPEQAGLVKASRAKQDDQPSK